MSHICEYFYCIERNNGSFDKIKREEFTKKLESYYEEFLNNDIYSIKKIYKLKDNKKIYNLSLFTAEYNFNSEDYIEHYKSLSQDKYGINILNNFDIEVIEKFN